MNSFDILNNYSCSPQGESHNLLHSFKRHHQAAVKVVYDHVTANDIP